jgi:hypothetical protein
MGKMAHINPVWIFGPCARKTPSAQKITRSKEQNQQEKMRAPSRETNECVL